MRYPWPIPTVTFRRNQDWVEAFPLSPVDGVPIRLVDTSFAAILSPRWEPASPVLTITSEAGDEPGAGLLDVGTRQPDGTVHLITRVPQAMIGELIPAGEYRLDLKVTHLGQSSVFATAQRNFED